jgi:hypothetical protein
MVVSNSSLFDETASWLRCTNIVKSAVLFGSSALHLDSTGRLPNLTSDLDLHLIVSDAVRLENVDWKSALPDEEFCFQACRPATGGVRKVTAIFASGQLDLVLVPLTMMCFAALGLRLGLYSKVRRFRLALNELATCLHSGYRVLKGQVPWGGFYHRVSRLSGVSVNDSEIRDLADASVCDVLWIFQKLEQNELIAAQHVLHSKVSDTNLRLWRELRRRQNVSMRSFGLGRRIEALGTESDRRLLRVDARLDIPEMRSATWKAFKSLNEIMAELNPNWRIPSSMETLLRRLNESTQRSLM